MEYVTATKAAQMIGVTPRTISDWLKSGKLTGHHPEGKRNRVAIPKSEVETIARERNLYREEKEASDNDTLKLRVEELENKVLHLESELHRISENRPIETFAYDDSSEIKHRQKRTTTPNKALPDGATSASDFAAMYGVSASTFRDHYTKGIGPAKEKALISSRPKPGREYQSEWYVMPDQVEGVINFWKRQGVNFHEKQLSIWQE
jgi:hypothetical protein